MSAVRNYNDIGLYVNSAKAVADDRKSTLLANSYTLLPPEYDLKNDANAARASWGIFRSIEWVNLLMNVHLSAKR